MQRVGIFGASGYTGLELLRLLAGHPHVELAFAGSEKSIGKRIDDLAPGCGRFGGVVRRSRPRPAPACVPARRCSSRRRPRCRSCTRCAIARRARRSSISPTSTGSSPSSRSTGCRSSTARRSQDRGLRRQPRLLPDRREPRADPAAPCTRDLGRRDRRRDERCERRRAARRGGGYSFVELEGSAKAYKVFAHQHQPEIAAALRGCSAEAIDLTFTPHLIPIARGILSTAYARTTKADDVGAAHRDPARCVRARALRARGRVRGRRRDRPGRCARTSA